ncbi:MAG: hypothetical protein U9O41_10155, partial [Candidatus Aerophobetes bacterium]|nr:hypothetical protein [Candidatus Aerophobetes bacterium]
MLVRQPKAGLIVVSLPRETPEIANNFMTRAIRELSKYVDVVHPDEIALDAETTRKYALELEKQDVDCILFVPGSWIFAPFIVGAIQSIRVPVGLWASPEVRTAAFVGACVTHGSLDEIGIKHAYFYGWPEEEALEVVKWIRAASAVKNLAGKVYGYIGGECMGMYTATVDFAQVQSLFKVRVKHMDQLILVEEAKKVNDKEAEEYYDQFKKDYTNIYVPDEIMLKSIKLLKAIKKVIEKEHFDFAGIKCQPELIDTYVSPCLAVSLINNEGTVIACEADTNGALTMEILHLLSNQPVLFADLYSVGREDRVLRLINCGTAPTVLAKDKRDVDWEYQFQYMGKQRGATTKFCCKPGKVTLARLVRIKGEYHMFISSGEAFEQPKEKFKEDKEIWPHAFIKLDADPFVFIQETRSNHI